MSIALRAMPAWLVMIMACYLLVGCGGADDETAPASSPPVAQSQPAPEPEAASPDEPEPAPEPEPAEAAPMEPAAAMPAAEDVVTLGEDGIARVTIGATDQMQYTVNAFAVEAGQEVELTLVHEGQLAVSVMGHNVVILQAGQDPIAFAQQVMSEGGSADNEYLPESLRDGLVAFTSLIGGGGSDTIRFIAPETPGEYPFLCTFPGHFGIMNGVMTVR